eukprot:2388566-Pyramimonas_sp.AAC.1
MASAPAAQTEQTPSKVSAGGENPCARVIVRRVYYCAVCNSVTSIDAYSLSEPRIVGAVAAI